MKTKLKYLADGTSVKLYYAETIHKWLLKKEIAEQYQKPMSVLCDDNKTNVIVNNVHFSLNERSVLSRYFNKVPDTTRRKIEHMANSDIIRIKALIKTIIENRL